MDNLYQQMLQRYRTLVHKKAEIAEQCRKLDIENLLIESEMQGAATYLKTGSNNPFVRRGLQEIAELTKELSSSAKRAQKVVQSKSHIVIRLLQEHSPEGLDIDEIMTSLQSQNTEIDRSYVTTILANLRKKAMAVRNGKKFSITDPGNKPIVAAG
jgi:hypothetical protein